MWYLKASFVTFSLLSFFFNVVGGSGWEKEMKCRVSLVRLSRSSAGTGPETRDLQSSTPDEYLDGGIFAHEASL